MNARGASQLRECPPVLITSEGDEHLARFAGVDEQQDLVGADLCDLLLDQLRRDSSGRQYVVAFRLSDFVWNVVPLIAAAIAVTRKVDHHHVLGSGSRPQSIERLDNSRSSRLRVIQLHDVDVFEQALSGFSEVSDDAPGVGYSKAKIERRVLVLIDTHDE